VRDLTCFGRPARLIWRKRRWRCREPHCDAKTWTETSEHVDAQVVLTRRARAEACRQVGEHARSVASVADEFGVCWWTVMNAVVEHGTPLVDDPHRVGDVHQLGVDETSFLRANRRHSTIYATGMVDLEAHRVIDMVQGNAAADLRRWCSGANPRWLAGIEVVATDLTDSYRAGLSPHLDHVQRVADPFHVVRLANRCIDDVRRRVQPPRPQA
jgi:transposase